MTHCLDYEATRIMPFVAANALRTEHYLARVHVAIGILGCAASAVLVARHQLPLIISPWLYLGGLFAYLVCVAAYLVFKPYMSHSLAGSAALLTAVDLMVATFIIINTGGLRSTFWGLWIAVLLVYVIRFRYGWFEIALTVVVFFITVALTNALAPDTIPTFSSQLIGVVFSVIAILPTGGILVGSERRAVRDALILECEAIHRMVNTVQHEVNNPLTAAAGNLLLLRERLENGHHRETFDKIDEALERIGTAVGRLNEFEGERRIEGVGTLERYTHNGG